MITLQTPSRLWTIAGIGLPLLTTVFAFIAAFTTTHRAISLCVGVVFAGATLLALQRAYAAPGTGQPSAARNTDSSNDPDASN